MANERKYIKDGYLEATPGGRNIHRDHIHVASDNTTILSWKVNNEHKYNRAETRKSIAETTGVNIKPGYTGG